ncbi:MAG: hypothetical protein ACC642_11390 [Pseudomonadales bacterium]
MITKMALGVLGVLGVGVLVCLPVTVSASTRARAEIEAKQLDLDEKCEAAREVLLSKERTTYIAECVQKKRNDPAECTRFYADHGDQTTTRAPLYYDLPECVEAFEFRTN